MKKLLSLLIALVMAFSLAVPALAYEDIVPAAENKNDILSTIVVKTASASEVMTVGTSSITVKPGTTRNQLLAQIEARDDVTLDCAVSREGMIVLDGAVADGDILNVSLRGKDYSGSYKIEVYNQAKIDEWGNYWDDPTYRSIDETVNMNVPTFKDVDYVITDAKYADLVDDEYEETYYHTLTMSGSNAATGEMRTQELVFHGYAIQAAIDEASANGGGRVVLPKTTDGDTETVYYTAAIWLKSNVNLYIAEGVRLAFVRNIDNKAYPIVLTQFEGSDLYNYSPFIYALNEKNIAITGKGTIDGQADHANWMNWKRGAAVLGQRIGDYNPQANYLTGGYSSGGSQNIDGEAMRAGDPIVGHNKDKVDVTRRIYTATGEAPPAGTKIPVVEDGVTKWIDIPADAIIGAAHKSTSNFAATYNQPSRLRPCFIEPYLSENILIEGITLNNSPMWEIHPTRSTNILVRNVIIDTTWNNNDGINPDSCKNVVIEDNEINTGDDCIAIKSGKNEDGQRRDTYSENIIIRRVNFARGHGGITIGSECAGAVRNLFTTDNAFNSSSLQTVIRFKTNSKRSSKAIEKMYHKDSTIVRASNQVIQAQTNYSAGGIDAGDYGAFIPVIKDLYLYNITSNENINCGAAFNITAYARAPISSIHVKNCTFMGVGNSTVTNVRGLELDNVQMSPRTDAEALATYNTTPVVISDVKINDGQRTIALDEAAQPAEQRISRLNTLTVTGRIDDDGPDSGRAKGSTVTVISDRNTSGTNATVNADGTFTATITLAEDTYALDKANHFISIRAANGLTGNPTVPNGNQDVRVFQVRLDTEMVFISEITLDRDEMTMFMGEEETLVATIVPEGPTEAGVVWVSDAPEVATVDQDGVVTAVGLGTANITVKSAVNDAIFATCAVTVILRPTTVDIRGAEVSLVNDPIEYIVSISNARGVMNATIIFEVDGDMLYGEGLEVLLASFTALSLEEGEAPAIRWIPMEGEGNIWQGEVTVAYLGGAEGFSSEAKEDLFKAIYGAKKIGDASMKITGVRLAGLDEDGMGIFLDAEIGVDEAVTLVREPDPVYSKFDLNKDGSVDERDLAMAQRFYGAEEGDANWAAASVCDFDEDGDVDMMDLVTLFINFTK